MISSFPTRIFKSNSDENLRRSNPLILDSPTNNRNKIAFINTLPTFIDQKSPAYATEDYRVEITALPVATTASKVKRKFNFFYRQSATDAEQNSKLASFKKAMSAPFKILKLSGKKTKTASKRVRPLIISGPSKFRHEVSGGGGPKRNSRGSWVNPQRTSAIQFFDERGQESLDVTHEVEWEDVA